MPTRDQVPGNALLAAMAAPAHAIGALEVPGRALLSWTGAGGGVPRALLSELPASAYAVAHPGGGVVVAPGLFVRDALRRRGITFRPAPPSEDAIPVYAIDEGGHVTRSFVPRDRDRLPRAGAG